MIKTATIVILLSMITIIVGCGQPTPTPEKPLITNIHTNQKLNFPEELLRLRELPKSPIIKDDDTYRTISIKLANYINKLGSDNYYLRAKLVLIKKWVDKRKKNEKSGS